MTDLSKPGRKKGFDPRKRKLRDNARLRKLERNGSDKAARKHAPKTKSRANGRARRLNALSLRMAEFLAMSADDGRVAHRVKERTWGSYNDAEAREERKLEREYLDQTPIKKIRGRRRFSVRE